MTSPGKLGHFSAQAETTQHCPSHLLLYITLGTNLTHGSLIPSPELCKGGAPMEAWVLPPLPSHPPKVISQLLVSGLSGLC